MKQVKLPLILIALVMVIGLGLQFWYWPQLPERMAIHFDAKGNPNDWLDKLPATLLSAGLVLILPIFFLGISQVTRWLPSSMINLPNRDYWLSPQRRDESLSWMRGWLIWFTVAISIFILLINHLTFIANRDAQPLPAVWFWGMLAAFLLATFVLVVIMIRRFRQPRPS